MVPEDRSYSLVNRTQTRKALQKALEHINICGGNEWMKSKDSLQMTFIYPTKHPVGNQSNTHAPCICESHTQLWQAQQVCPPKPTNMGTHNTISLHCAHLSLWGAHLSCPSFCALCPLLQSTSVRLSMMTVSWELSRLDSHSASS